MRHYISLPGVMICGCSRVWGGVPDDTQEAIMGSGNGRQRLRRIVVSGPLAAFADGLRRELAS